MTEKKLDDKPQIPNQDAEVKNQKQHYLPALILIIVAFSIVVGYIVGAYHFQITALIGPVFGYKAHSGSIDLSSVQETYNKLASNFDGSLDTKKLIQGASRGLVDAAGDDYTTYMNVDEAEEFSNDLSGNIGGGIGAEIGSRNGKIVILRVLSDNPAKEAGLQANDIILNVNDEPTSGWTVEKTVGLVRGEVGTTVKLTIQREEMPAKEYTVTRDTVSNPSVDSSIKDDIGIMTLYRFDGQTGDLAKVAAQGFVKESVKGVVLDLRGNGGGYVDAAKRVAELWLDGKIVAVEKSGKVVKDTVKTFSGRAILSGIPTVVLVNGGSASASEILAGALQDYGLAKLVGEKTFGKGSVQLPLDLSDGGILKVTVAKWYTPKGKNINKSGIKPDLTVELTRSDMDNGVDPQVNAAIKLLMLVL